MSDTNTKELNKYNMCKKGQNWTEQETRTFLELCIEKQILAIIDGKKHKHIDIFRMLVPEMERSGYLKTAGQMKLKLKNLKLAYFKCRRNNSVSGAAATSCPFYNELELLYGCRPTVEAEYLGVDTATSSDNNKSAHNTICENIETSDTVNDTVCDETSEDQENEPVRKKRKLKLSGRKSYQTLLDNHTEKWIESQKLMLDTMLDKQDKMHKELIQQEMEKQREWEQREMEKERDFQREQTNLIMQTFLQSMHALRPQIPTFPQNTYMPLKLIPMNRTNQSSNVNQDKRADTKATLNEDKSLTDP